MTKKQKQNLTSCDYLMKCHCYFSNENEKMVLRYLFYDGDTSSDVTWVINESNLLLNMQRNTYLCKNLNSFLKFISNDINDVLKIQT